MTRNPIVKEVALTKQYNFDPVLVSPVLCAGGNLYVFLERHAAAITALQFSYSLYKLGHPIDVASGWHPLSAFGLGFRGLYEVEKNSPWIDEYRTWNLNGPQYNEALFVHDKHFVVCAKDASLEIIARRMSETQITEAEISSIVARGLDFLGKQDD